MRAVIFGAMISLCATATANSDFGDQLAKILASDGRSGDFYGFASALDQNLAVVGAHGHSFPKNFGGAAYVYDVSDPANPIELHKLIALDGSPADRFRWCAGSHRGSRSSGSANSNHMLLFRAAPEVAI